MMVPFNSKGFLSSISLCKSAGFFGLGGNYLPGSQNFDKVDIGHTDCHSRPHRGHQRPCVRPYGKISQFVFFDGIKAVSIKVSKKRILLRYRWRFYESFSNLISAILQTYKMSPYLRLGLISVIPWRRETLTEMDWLI